MVGAVDDPGPAFASRAVAASRPPIGAIALLLVALTGCTSSDAPSPDTTADFPAISGKVGETPVVEFTEGADAEQVESLVITNGSGDTVTRHDLVASHQVIYEWGPDGSAREAYTSHDAAPLLISVSALTEIAPEIAEAFAGVEVGTRLAMVFPDSSSPLSPGTETEGKNDNEDTSTLFILDILDRYEARSTVDQKENETVFDGAGELPDVRASRGRPPQVSIPDTAPPDEPTTTFMIEGDGETATAGSTIVTQFQALTWADATEFDSTWEYGAVPKDFVLEPSSVIEGWLNGLEGARAGSRVMLTVPPESGYGSRGNAAVDVGPDETLVYVIDILDVIATT
ncbi:FKBP-type peptidyl-prolyl cis-trans isomerase [Nocardiopsis sp. MG754419]|nr:FKBP-type peptidyl-prolyl cis-trans isomerase [Nocardiopsis sp. MG754419]